MPCGSQKRSLPASRIARQVHTKVQRATWQRIPPLHKRRDGQGWHTPPPPLHGNVSATQREQVFDTPLHRQQVTASVSMPCGRHRTHALAGGFCAGLRSGAKKGSPTFLFTARRPPIEGVAPYAPVYLRNYSVATGERLNCTESGEIL